MLRAIGRESSRLSGLSAATDCSHESRAFPLVGWPSHECMPFPERTQRVPPPLDNHPCGWMGGVLDVMVARFPVAQLHSLAWDGSRWSRTRLAFQYIARGDKPPGFARYGDSEILIGPGELPDLDLAQGFPIVGDDRRIGLACDSSDVEPPRAVDRVRADSCPSRSSRIGPSHGAGWNSWCSKAWTGSGPS